MLLEKTILPKNYNFLIKNFNILLKFHRKLLNKKRYKILNTKKQSLLKNNQKLIKYIITVKYYRTSTSITASKINGNIFFFCTTKPSLIKKKRNINRKNDIKNLIIQLLNECSFIIKQPIALHLLNVNYNKKQIIKLFFKFFILITKTFNNTPHNGCRPTKKRRIKKRTKKRFLFPKIKQKKLLFLKNMKNIKIIKNNFSKNKK
jgi:hypothetical protein